MPDICWFQDLRRPVEWDQTYSGTGNSTQAQENHAVITQQKRFCLPAVFGHGRTPIRIQTDREASRSLRLYPVILETSLDQQMRLSRRIFRKGTTTEEDPLYHHTIDSTSHVEVYRTNLLC